MGQPLDSVFRIVNETSREVVENPVSKVLAHGHIVGLANHTILIARDGTERPIDDSAAPIKNDQAEIEGVILVFRDITERHREEKLKDRRARNAALTAAIGLAFSQRRTLPEMLSASTDAIVHHLDTAFARIWTLDAESNVLELQTSSGIYTHIDGPHRRVPVGAFKIGRIAEEKKPHLTNDVQHDPDVSDQAWANREGMVAFAGYPLLVESRLLGVIALFARQPLADDTLEALTLVADVISLGIDRKRSEEVLKTQATALKAADHRKDEFLAMLAHELRNPLGVISNGIQLVQLSQQPEMLGQISDLIEHQVKHLTHLIDDLLDVSRITQGKITLKKETVELGAIVDRAVELVRPLVMEKRHVLTTSVPEEIRFVADPTRAVQILGNLLTNAAKYSEPEGSIHLAAVVDGDQVVMRVRDNGIGIPPEMLSHVFELFTQVDATLDRSQGGLGIGLTLVHSLVEMHGGQVSAASEGKDKGSEFTVRLPIGTPEADRLTTDAGKLIKPKATGRILVVDDNEDTARLTARMLTHYGYEVETAHDGLAAIEQARRLQPGVILLDIGLPGMNGYEVATQLRDDDCCKSAVLIAISGYGEETARERSKAAGFSHHLIKPLDFGQLMKLI
jgi:signal transduction histidine kinase